MAMILVANDKQSNYHSSSQSCHQVRNDDGCWVLLLLLSHVHVNMQYGSIGWQTFLDERDVGSIDACSLVTKRSAHDHRTKNTALIITTDQLVYGLHDDTSF